ncbi:hypothetical protein BVRB_2g025070 [Beta vulgaris subsp. vulgaris]|nr:hypothetical protein BVRB_2g025070 [Beta vulgaris subsp. vulgaris]
MAKTQVNLIDDFERLYIVRSEIQLNECRIRRNFEFLLWTQEQSIFFIY